MALVDWSSFMLLNQTVAALSALLRSVEYARLLGIRRRELIRYLKKSVSFGLCYAGFGTPGRVREAWMAGEAAFLCCAYDVVTDWRHFDDTARSGFEIILRARAPEPEIQDLAISLYDKEQFDSLSADGLERGAIALRFTLKMMGCERARETSWRDLDRVGYLLQIVDDVLDYEEDIASGDTNCLKSARRDTYLEWLRSEMGSVEARGLFGDNGSVLVRVIESAWSKAERLVQTERVAALQGGHPLLPSTTPENAIMHS